MPPILLRSRHPTSLLLLPEIRAFFLTNAHSFSISGGAFTSVTNVNQAAPTIPADFRRITLGDLDLRREILLAGSSCILGHDHKSTRFYAARIHGSVSDKTVTVYQGANADETWERDLSRYSSLRHPNLAQVFGIVVTPSLRAAIFNDELIPARRIVDAYGTAHLSNIYLHARFAETKEDARNYLFSHAGALCFGTGTEWIRASTGTFVVDTVTSCSDPVTRLVPSWKRDQNWTAKSLLEQPEDQQIIDSISLQCYHMACFHLLSKISYTPELDFAASSIRLGAIGHCTLGKINMVDKEIACIPGLRPRDSGWLVDPKKSVIMKNGWIRLESNAIIELDDGVILFESGFKCGSSAIGLGGITEATVAGYWLSQAEFIFSRLNIIQNLDQHFLITSIQYHLLMAPPDADIPAGYLFLRPPADFEVEPGRFRRPDIDTDAYWSCDPSGVERLSLESAAALGFPYMDFDANIWGRSWGKTVYDGLRQVHRAKGCNPNNQEDAQQLGLPRYQVSDGIEDLVTKVDGTGEHDDEKSSNITADQGSATGGSGSGSIFDLVKDWIRSPDLEGVAPWNPFMI
ncbi:hypothetical protein DFH06DRAFT_512444 [Mycena polygramma]|nr:hypothetical protein DFH06DRAFT_512444 [Mycena polygramma]